MLDDMRVLREAAYGYRDAAVAVGVTWPDHSDADTTSAPAFVQRLFDVDHVAEQPAWLESQGWGTGRLFPGGGMLLPWPTAADAGQALDLLSYSVGTPFPWRHQMPLFRFSALVFTVVLAGEHEGEIWRYEIAPDGWDPVRAAPSLAALFTRWTAGLAAGAVHYTPEDGWLRVGDLPGSPTSPGLDPFAFPVSVTLHPRLRERQAECGVNLDCVDAGFDCWEELLNEVDAVRDVFEL
jgi:hypothetical protein